MEICFYRFCFLFKSPAGLCGHLDQAPYFGHVTAPDSLRVTAWVSGETVPPPLRDARLEFSLKLHYSSSAAGVHYTWLPAGRAVNTQFKSLPVLPLDRGNVCHSSICVRVFEFVHV